jgi:hypothetical protein
MLGVLLPLTSKGVDDPQQSIKEFSSCLPFDSKVFIGIDEDDSVWSTPEGQIALKVAFHPIEISIQKYQRESPAPICAIARSLAQCALKSEDCEYFALLGDDLQVSPKRTWMQNVEKTFHSIAKSLGVAPGFGCVALNDRSFKGFPTFPVVHRTHMNIFDGQIFPEVFVNQDADPWLWEIYRKFGASRFDRSVEVINSIGGDSGPR